LGIDDLQVLVGHHVSISSR